MQINAARVATNVGWTFFPPHWGNGFSSEALGALAEPLERGGVGEQRAIVTEGNVDSVRVAERCGFVRTGYAASKARRATVPRS